MIRWVQAWGQAHTDLSAFSFSDRQRTVRLVIRSAISGDRVRVRLSDRYGKMPLAIRGVSAAPCDENGVLTGDGVDLSAPQKLETGGSVLTGAGALKIEAGEYFCVSVCVAGPLRSGDQLSDAKCVIMAGDRRHAIVPRVLPRFKDRLRLAAQALLRLPLHPPVPLIETVELYNSDGASSVVVFGDSLSQQGYWVNPFAARLAETYPGRYSVINRSIGGNRVLRDTSPAFPLKGYYGERALARLERDVLRYVDVSHVVMEIGINDLIQYASISGFPSEKPDIDELTGGIFAMARRMRSRGIKVMGTTLIGFRDCADGSDEKSRLCDEVNARIRENASAFDVLFDMNGVTADPERPQHTFAGYLGGDKLHFNVAGGEAVAQAVDLTFFEPEAGGQA